MPAGEKRLQLLDSELLQAIGVADFRRRVAVVEAHLGLVAVLAQLEADVPEAVELGADLADLGCQELVMVDELVRAEWAARRSARDTQGKGARAE